MKDMTQTDIYIKMTPPKRLEIAMGLFDFAFEYLKGYFKNRYPDYNEEKISELVKERISYGRKRDILKNDFRKSSRI